MASYESTSFEDLLTPGISSEDIQGMVVRIAKEQGVDPDLALRIARQESRFNPAAVSSQGARGVMQLMPGTAKDMGVQDVHDPEQNIMGGVKYLALLDKRFQGDESKVRAAYHSGPEAVAQGGLEALGPKGRDYVQKTAPNRGSKIAGELATSKATYEPMTFGDTAPTKVTYEPMFPEEAKTKDAPKQSGVVESAGSGLMRGVFGLAEAVNTGLQFIGNRVGSSAMAGQGQSGVEYWNDKAKPFEPGTDIQGAISDNPALLLKGAWWAYNLADMAPSFAAAIIPGVGAAKSISVAGKVFGLTEKVIERLAIAGGAVVGGGAGGALEGAQTYQEALKRGAPEGEAAVAGSMMAMASAALNAISVGKVISPGKASALRRFLTTGSVEGLTEWAEEPAEGAILSQTSVAKPEDDPGSRAIRGLNVLPIAAVMGGGAGVIAGGGKETPQNAQEAPAAAPAATVPPAPESREIAPSSQAVEAGAPASSGADLPLLYPGAPVYSRYRQAQQPQPPEAPAGLALGEAEKLSPIDQARVDARVLNSGQDLPGADEARLKNATLVAIYGENAAVRHVIEGGGQFSAIGDAMLLAAPAVERARGAIAQNERSRDVTDEILGAVDEIAKLKESGESVAEILAEGATHDISYEGQQLIQFLDENAENPQRLAAFLESYLNEVESATGVPSEVRGRAFDIIEERNQARKDREEKRQAELKRRAFEQTEAAASREKAATTAKAKEQEAAERVLREIAVAKAAGSGVNPEHVTAIELAFRNAKKLKGKPNAKPTGNIQGATPGGPQAGPGQAEAGSGKGAIPVAPAAREQGYARPVRPTGNQPGAQTPSEVNRGAQIAAELKPVDAAAHEAAASPKNELPQPTKAQILAGNPKLGHPTVGGLDVSIENPEGSTREDKQNTPPKWKREIKEGHYGYIKGVPARSPDKAHVDVFVKPGTPEGYNGPVFVIDQNKGNGQFDESKTMIGYASEKEARSAYLKNYEKGWESRIRRITEMTMGQFKTRLQDDKAFLSPQGEEVKASLSERLKNPDLRSELQNMANEAGWAEIGGMMIRDPVTGDVTGRTKWVPRAAWWPDRPEKLNANKVRAAVKNALAGEPLKRTEARTIAFMLDEAGRTLREGAAVPEGVDRFIEEDAALTDDLSEDDQQDALLLADETDGEKPSNWATMTEEDKENELDRLFGKDTRKTAPGAQGGEATPATEVEPREFALAGETEADLKAKAAAEQAAIDAKKAAEAKAAADDQRGGFNLTGSDRAADVGAAAGQTSILEQAKPQYSVDQPWYYSALARGLESANIKAAPAAAWRDYIKGLVNKGTVKADEVEWTGISDWLATQTGKVTKEQVTAFMEQGGVRVTEQMLGEPDAIKNALTPDEKSMYDMLVAKGALEGVRHLTNEEINTWQELREKVAPVENRTKFETYQLPGSVPGSYRELVLTLPEAQPTVEGLAARKAVFEKYQKRIDILRKAHEDLAGKEGVMQDRLTLSRKIDELEKVRDDEANAAYTLPADRGGKDEFKSTHFPDAGNYLAHTRVNDRILPDGRKVLFVEEIQSDRAQKGRTEGFKGADDEARIKQLQDLGADATRAEREELQTLQGSAFNKIAPAPFVTKTDNWTALVLKRLLAYAASGDYAYISWTRGDQQVERYTSALRKAVDVIEWKKTPEGVQIVGYKGKAARNEAYRIPGDIRDEARGAVTRNDFLGFDTAAEALTAIREHGDWRTRWEVTADADIVALNNYRVAWLTSTDSAGGRQKVVDTTEKESALSDAIGKSMADRIRNDPNQTGTIEGENITVSDTGMAGYYDRIVPKVAQEVAKKVGGGRVVEVKIQTEAFVENNPLSPAEEARWRELNGMNLRGELAGRGARALAAEHTALTEKRAGGGAIEETQSAQQAIEITPAMREKIMAGQTLFQPKPVYNSNQLELIYDHIETRPETKPAQREAGIAALRALFLGDRRAGATLLGSALWRDFQERAGSELIGAQAGSAQELALAAQILRDPRFETLRVFFTKGNEIVGHTGWTSRLPGAVAFSINDGTIARKSASPETRARLRLVELMAQMKRLGADGYYLLHNHPSGVSKPSYGDLAVTRHLAREMDGFRGHVVIDHGEYSYIEASGNSVTKQIPKSEQAAPELAHDALGRKIEAPHTLVSVGKRLAIKNGYGVLIATNATGRIQALAEVPENLLARSKDPIGNARAIVRVRKFMNQTGSAGGAFLVAENPARFDWLIENGSLTDAVDPKGYATRAEMGEVKPKESLHGRDTKLVLAARQMQFPRDQTQTEEFRRWFGDSKVVDAEGKPLVVYHGTPEQFTSFDPSKITLTNAGKGFYFTENLDDAALFGKNTVSAYLSIQKPFDFNKFFSAPELRALLDKHTEIVGEMTDLSLDAGAFGEQLFEAIHHVTASRGATTEFLKRAGYDGIKLRVEDEAGSPARYKDYNANSIAAMPVNWVAFHPTQIKSAIGNTGAFDPTNPNILEQERPIYQTANAAFNEAAGSFSQKLGAAKQAGYVATARNLVGRIDQALNPLGTLPGQREYLVGRYLAQGMIEKADESARGVAKALDGASEADRKAIYDYFVTASANANQIENASVRAEAQRIKAEIGRIGDELVAKGLLSAESREEYRDAYLPRLYLKHLLSESDWKALGAGKKPSDMGYLKSRKDIPEEVRKVILGEITDPGFLASVAIAKPARDMALLDWLAQISENKNWILPGSVVEYTSPLTGQTMKATPHFLKEGAARLRKQARYYAAEEAAKAETEAKAMDQVADDALDGIQGEHSDYKQIPTTARYGRLRGLMVRTEIYNDLMGVSDFLPTDPGWFQNIFGYGGTGTKATQIWKAMKVSMNPPSQVRNFISNMIALQLFAGVPLHLLPSRFFRAVNEIKTQGKYFQIARKYGVGVSTFATQEIYRMKTELLDLEMKTRGMGALGRLHRIAGLLMNKSSDFYQLSETLGKTMAIIDAMERQGKSEADAVMLANESLFDYSLIQKWARYARSAPIGIPFLTYNLKVLPRLIETALLHPQRFIPWVTLFYGFPMLVASMLGVDGDDLDKLKKALPQWLQDKGHALILPYKDDNDRWQVVDLGYFMPWSNWAELAKNVASGEMGKAAQTAGIFGGPVTDMIVAIKTGKDPFTGRDIIQKGDPPERQIYALMNYMWSMAAPPFLTERGLLSPTGILDKAYGGRAVQALSGTTNRAGEPRSTARQALLYLAGINLSGITPEYTRAQNLKTMAREIQDVKLQMMQKLYDRSLSEERRKEIANEYVSELTRRVAKLQKYAKESEISPTLH